MRALLALLFLLAPIGEAFAHTRSQSQSRWSVEGDALDVRVEAEAVDVTRLYALGGAAPLAETFAAEVGRGLSASAGGRPCRANAAPQARLGEDGRVVAAWRLVCPAGALAGGALTIESRLFDDVAPTHLHFAAVRGPGGAGAEAVLTMQRPRAVLRLATAAPSESFGQAFARFIPIGAGHVWSGLDHVAFILALVLLSAGSVRALGLAATGFTLGHTATLALAALDVVRPDALAVEAMIGFTIAFVALEAGPDGRERMRAWSAPASLALACAGVLALAQIAPMSPLIWFGLAAFVFAYPRGFPRGAVWLAAIFGLIHGCGFAGALAELELPRPRLLAALVGFNLGVEAAQIAVIAAALTAGALGRRFAPESLKSALPGMAGAVLFALGAYWFVQRLLA